MLMGFIRKISTFFIHQVRYSRDELKGCYEEGVRKRLVTDKKGLILPLHIKSRLLNYDLSMSFQDESVLLAREGTVIDYIQH